MTVELALEQMSPGLQSIYGDLIDSIILYGSTARGTRQDDSDAVSYTHLTLPTIGG